ncbi:MAG TPA: hypothetical protein ENK65_02990 [Helicobacteraceae bacterium]|nr:hypothetical protein [Helicobacteraceae bacterium]
MVILKSVRMLLEHIKAVEEDTINLSKESLLKLSAYLEKNNMEIDDDVAEALQYQDIISQQLSATIEAIDAVHKSLEIFDHAFNNDEKLAVESMDKLQDKLGKALTQAKEKRDAFSGHIHQNSDDDDAIEFF